MSNASQKRALKNYRNRLTERGIDFATTLPSSPLAPGSVTFIAAADDVEHADFIAKAWVEDPLKAVLAEVPGFSRIRAGAAPSRKR